MEEAETRAAAATAVALNTKAHAAFEGQRSDRIAKSDVVKDTMSACGEAREGDLRARHQSANGGMPLDGVALLEKAGNTERDELWPVQGGAEDTDERVMTSHTEMCEGCESPSVEEGHDVERVTAQNDEIVGLLRQLKDETSADLAALDREGGVGSEDQTSGSYESRDAANAGESATLERQVTARRR